MRTHWLMLALLLLLPVVALAEDEPFMFAEQNAPLNLQIPGSNGWSAQCASIEPYGGIIYPGQTVNFSLVVTNTSKDKVLAGKPTLEIVRFGTHLEKVGGQPSNFHSQGHLLTYVPLDPPTRLEQAEITLKPGEKTIFVWKPTDPQICANFGTYLAIVDIAGVGRQPAATFARCHPYNVKDTGDGKGSPIFWSLHHEDRAGQLKISAAAGYRWIRTDGFPNWQGADRDFPRTMKPFDWTELDRDIAQYRQLGLWIQSNMYGSPPNTITPGNWKTYNYVHQPKYDYRWGDYVEEAVRRYCGPDGSGPLQIIDYWNEPWEGGGISAWKSDSVRYRQLYKILYERAHKGSPAIAVGGASSIMNTADKFMTVANWQDLYSLDVFTDHYVQPYCSYGPRLAKKYGVFSIETETWIAFDEHQFVGVASHFMASGQSKVNCNHPAQLIWRNGDAGWLPKPTMMGANTFLYMVGARPFTKMIFQNNLPYLYQYGSGKDAVYILAGDRRLLNPAAVDMYNQIHANGTITIEAIAGKVKAYDVYGNPFPVVNGKYVLPLSREAVFLTAPGEAETLVPDVVRAGQIRDLQPVQLMLQDFNTPLTASATLDVEVHNVLNRDVVGKLTITPPAGMTLEPAAQNLAVPAGTVKHVTFAVKGAPNAANAYPVTATFDANADGKATLTEVLHVNAITRGTPAVDGNLADWNKSLPVMVYGADLKRDATTAAWKPWEKESDVKAGMAEVRFLYDDTYLYAAIRERSDKYVPKPRLSTDPLQDDCFGIGDMAQTYVKPCEPTSPYNGNCVQIGLDVTNYRTLPALPGVPERMLALEDTDYEYAVWGTPDGGSDIWRSVTPRMKLFHFLPRCMPAGYDGVPRGAKAVVRRDGQDTIYEIAIPLADMPEWRPTPGQDIHIALRLPASRIELGFGRSVCRSNGLTLLPRWEVHASNDVRWGVGK